VHVAVPTGLPNSSQHQQLLRKLVSEETCAVQAGHFFESSPVICNINITNEFDFKASGGNRPRLFRGDHPALQERLILSMLRRFSHSAARDLKQLFA
jgi:hypothetical protein